MLKTIDIQSIYVPRIPIISTVLDIAYKVNIFKNAPLVAIEASGAGRLIISRNSAHALALHLISHKCEITYARILGLKRVVGSRLYFVHKAACVIK